MCTAHSVCLVAINVLRHSYAARYATLSIVLSHPAFGRCTMQPAQSEPLVRKVDCIQIHVPDLDVGLAFYCDQVIVQGAAARQ